jgi:hypothetical protein
MIVHPRGYIEGSQACRNLMRNRALARARTFVISAAMLMPLQASGEYNSFRLSEGLGGFLFATGLLEQLSKSECSYAVKNQVSYAATIAEALLYFNERDRQKILIFANEPKRQKDISEYLDGMRNAAKKDGVDEKTICGFMISNVGMVYGVAKQRWEDARTQYSK